MLYAWWDNLSEENRNKWTKIVIDDFNAEAPIFGSNIAKEITIKDWEKALEESSKIACQGKIIISLE